MSKGKVEKAAFSTAIGAQVPGLLTLVQTVSDPPFTLLMWVLFGSVVCTILIAKRLKWLPLLLKVGVFVVIAFLLRENFEHWQLVVGEPEVFIATMLILVSMILTAGATTLREALMGIVPHLSAFGLIGTSNVSAVVAANFLAFVLLGTFSLSAHLAGNIGAREERRTVADLTILSGLAIGVCAAVGTVVSVLTAPPIPKTYSLPLTPFMTLMAEDGRFRDFLVVGLGNPRSERVVMEVKALSDDLLRVAVYDQYRGSYWAVRRGRPKLVLPRKEGEFLLAPWLPRSDELRKIEVTVKSSRVDFIACPGRPVIVKAPVDAVWMDVGSTAKMAWPLPVGAKYEVLYTPELTLPWEDPEDDPVYSTPPILQSRLVRLAEEVAKEGSPLEKAKQIEYFLKTRCAYAYSPAFIPRGWDPVEHFVLRSKQGACDLFASAFVLMCRAVGIPARVVAGFRMEERDKWRRVFVVREKHSHAWAEAWIPGLGWVSFDPTPPAPEELARSPLDFLRQWGWLRTGNRPFYLVAFLSLLAMGYALMLRRERPLSRLKGVSAIYLAACKRLERVGLRREPYETPWEFLLKAREHLPRACFEPFYQLTLLLIALVYGGKEMSETRAKRLLAEIKRGMRRGHRSWEGNLN